jgi:serine/threonine-protein kinase
MASVFRATTPEGTVVAVKVLHPASVLPEDVKRFTREFDALSQMDHPNIVKVFEAGIADGFPWIAMEYVDGEDLEQTVERWLDDPPAEKWERVEAILRGLCNGLQYVHDKNLVHRDLKPTNVLLTQDGIPKVSDFGVVKDPNATGTQLTKAGRLIGTVAFMAPEQITGDTVDHRTDLYSLGAVLYVMLTGKRPIEAGSVAGYLARHLTEIPTAPGQIDPTVPPRLEQVCARLLAKDPDQRYATARAVLQALDRPASEARLPLRGRDAAMALWGRLLSGLDEGQAAVLALIGPRGAGRTFLLDTMAPESEAHGTAVAQSAPGDKSPVRALASVLDLEVPDDELPTAVVAALGDTPMVLLVDDLDRFSAKEVEALEWVIRRVAAGEVGPLLVVFTATSTRNGLAGIGSGTTTGLPPEKMPLTPLDRATVITLVRDRDITGPAAPVLGRRLHEDYGGLPGAIDQQLQALFVAGWLEKTGDAVRVCHPVKNLRHDPLPVPEAARIEIEAQLSRLDQLSRELVEVLSLLGRPASASLLERCASDPAAAARALDRLVDAALLRRVSTDADETLELTHPRASAVIVEALGEDEKRTRHAVIAKALSSRHRRDAAREVAMHLMHAGEFVAAYPMFVRAARRAARAGLFFDVLEICRTAERVQPGAESGMAQEDAVRCRRWLLVLEGEAQLARGRWEQALGPLELAVAAARTEDDGATLARCLGSLGRAHYRRGHFDLAAPLLEEALECAEAGDPARASATRALADIRLRDGRIEEATDLWQEALDLAVAIGSRDGEARARRGLAHVCALQGKLARSAELLDAAEDLLQLGGDDRVRAGVITRNIELDAAAGRYGSALHRIDALIELAHHREMAERLPDAYALQADVLEAVGDREGALRAARESLTYAGTFGPATWNARLRVTRALCELDAWERAAEALPDPNTIPRNRVDDPSAQHTALRARLLTRERTAEARDLAHWVLVRPPPLLSLRAARIALDVSHAMRECGDVENARNAAKRGLRALEGPGADGLRLKLLLALNAAAPDKRVLQAAGQIASRIAETLPVGIAERFRGRPDLAEALGDGG